MQLFVFGRVTPSSVPVASKQTVTIIWVEFVISPLIDWSVSLPSCSCSGTLGLCVSVGFWPWAQSLYLRRNASMSTAAGSCLKKVVVSHFRSLSPCSLVSASWQGYWYGGITVFGFMFLLNRLFVSCFVLAQIMTKCGKEKPCQFKR